MILVRHAQAERYDTAGDLRRQLTARGQQQAEALGHALAPYLVDVGAVFVSPAQRAADTWNIAAGAATRAGATLPDPLSRPVIYSGDAEDITELVRFEGHGCVTVIVGHLPAIAETGVLLAQRGAAAPNRMGTGSAVILRADCDWPQWHAHVADSAQVVSAVK